LPYCILYKPITVAARSKARTVFACSNTGVVGSNRTRNMDVCVRLFCVCVVLYVGSCLAKGWSHIQGVLRTVYRVKKPKWRSRSKRAERERFHIDIYFEILETYKISRSCLYGSDIVHKSQIRTGAFLFLVITRKLKVSNETSISWQVGLQTASRKSVNYNA
jgi:hypothetical protein